MEISPLLEIKITGAARALDKSPQWVLSTTVTLGLAVMAFNPEQLKIFEAMADKALK